MILFLIIILGAGVITTFVLDGVAQSIIEAKGSEGLGVPLKVDQVHIGFLTKESSVQGLTIANPKEYIQESPLLLSVREAEIEFGLLNLLEKEVEIPLVTVRGVVLHLQQMDGKSNIELLLHHINDDETPEAQNPSPKFNISVLTIKDITVIAHGKFTVLDSGPVTAHIDTIELHNIGTDGDVEVATEAITTAVTHAIMHHLSEHPVEGFSKIAFSKITDFINTIPVFKQLGIGSLVQGVTDTVGKGLDDILGGLGDLLDLGKDNGEK